MEERLLTKCENSISANNIINMLTANDIASRQHDEKQDQNFGAYGPTPGIAIYVYEKDYRKALEIITPVLEQNNENTIFCPRCGSENIAPISRKHDYGTILGSLCLFFFIAPAVYYAWTKGNSYPIGNIIAWIMVAIGLVLLLISSFYSNNQKCSNCGKRFHHR